jgi:HSA
LELLRHTSQPSMEEAALRERKQAIVQRLAALSASTDAKRKGKRAKDNTAVASTSSSQVVPIVMEKSDTHWDYLLKEMQWLAADFMAERKRHVAGAKKCAAAAAAHGEGAAARETRALGAARQQQRKVAARLGRACLKQYWGPVQRVITYQQKLSYDQFRQQQMNLQLVRLVQQTEQYTALLANEDTATTKTKNPLVRIEAALAQTASRRGKHRVQDYARLWQEVVTTDGEASWREESATEEHSGSSDASYSAGSSSTDDESTLRAAEAEERRERCLWVEGDESGSFVADPRELLQLQEEADMDIDQVIERLRHEEGGPSNNLFEEEKAIERRVQFAEPRAVDLTGCDADDDMDASDVEDYQEKEDDEEEEEEEYVMELEEPDDETTLEQEERLPLEMSAAEEILLLQQENELSLEELRQKYSAALANPLVSSDAMDTDMERDEASTAPDVAEGEEDDDEYIPALEEVDDETTLAAEEQLGREMSYAEELALLQRDNEMSVDELRARYAAAAVAHMVPGVTDTKETADVVPAVEEEDATINTETHKIEAEDRWVKRRRVEGDTSATEDLVPEERPRLVTRPFLIPPGVKLREYQHVGLHWLVALQTRRLNGILADGTIVCVSCTLSRSVGFFLMPLT